MVSSSLDAAVAAHRADTAHVWVSFVHPEDPATTIQLCSRCGRPQGTQRNPAHGTTTTEPEYLPCRGFV